VFVGMRPRVSGTLIGVKVALLTPAPLELGPVPAAERTVRALLPHLRERFELDVFVGTDGGAELDGRPVRTAAELRPRAYDQVLYAIWNDARCAFAFPFVRDVGGTVALFEWRLPDAARAAFPDLAVPGPRARWLHLREGGPEALSARRTAEPALNRSIVRRADAFLVPSAELRERVLADRNEPTPIAVADPAAGPEATAAAWVEALERFPRHRVARKSVLRNLVDALRGGALRAQGRGSSST
jgi:hypothetical protein